MVEKKKDKSLNNQVGWNLYRTGMMMRREGARMLMRYNLTPEQWQIMMILGSKGALTQKALGDITLQDAPAISRAVQRLIVKNYAKKSSSNKDKRAVQVEITGKGGLLLSDIESRMKKAHRVNNIYQNFSDVKKRQLIKLLTELRSNLENNIHPDNFGGEK
ncbi:MAG: winged helix-turn-helix transcriptional regulator [Candidatus Goldbacteria bacterium]|nr:winged helix-turn-helix transcriptional regulator [Candidatus Goldiibacteriota bacterium]